MLSKENGQKMEYLEDLNPRPLCLIVFAGFATEFKDYGNGDILETLTGPGLFGNLGQKTRSFLHWVVT